MANIYKEYEESDAVKAAKANLDSTIASQPGEYQSKYQTQINAAINAIQNRGQFRYDSGSDPLYNQYKNSYVKQGRTAMMDTMGQAAALTGGYGNSYAQSVGQQTYQSYLSQLNDKIPELYSLALNAYQQQSDDLQMKYSVLSDAEDTDYGKYRDAVADWQANRDYYSDAYDSERSYDYTRYTDNRDFLYQQERDAVADAQWQAEYNLSLGSSSGGSSGGGGSRSSGSYSSGYSGASYSKELATNNNSAAAADKTAANRAVASLVSKTGFNNGVGGYKSTYGTYAKYARDVLAKKLTGNTLAYALNLI